MADLIDRQAAIETLNKLARDNFTLADAFSFYLGALHDAADNIKQLPSTDAEPVRHGHWVLCKDQNQDDVNNGNYLYVCSNCNYSDIHAETVEVPFCWHCGARMGDE